MSEQNFISHSTTGNPTCKTSNPNIVKEFYLDVPIDDAAVVARTYNMNNKIRRNKSQQNNDYNKVTTKIKSMGGKVRNRLRKKIKDRQKIKDNSPSNSTAID